MRTFSRVEAREGTAVLLPILGERPAFIPRALDLAPPAQRYAVLVAVLVAIGTFLILQVLHGAVPGTGADLRAVLRAARTAEHGHDIYAPALQFLDRGNLRQILKMSTTPYVYPPPLALLTRPLTVLPMRLDFALWDALNVTMLAILFVAVIRLSKARAFRELVVLSLIYGFFPLDMGLG
ncbi:MAG: glycosyltransferase 87 family protein, partial [Chloroflexota bacterium]